MSDQRKKTDYDQMTVAELAAVMKADLEAADNTGLDSETLLHVMQLYAQRAELPPTTAQEAFAAFQRSCLQQAHEQGRMTDTER